MTQHYFAKDGKFGDADSLIILDTSDWTTEHWEVFDPDNESEQFLIAQCISLGFGSIDQQDCPVVVIDDDENEQHCDFVGYVYRHFEYPAQGESGGYTWECPACHCTNSYEGDL